MDKVLGGEKLTGNQREIVIYVTTLLVSDLSLYKCYVTDNVMFTLELWPPSYIVIYSPLTQPECYE